MIEDARPLLFPAAVPNLVLKVVDENVLVHDPDGDMIHVLNRSAGRILQLADGSRNVDQIVETFAIESSLEVEAVRADVTGIITEFQRLSLVTRALG